jgi:hypothetical protein
MVTSRPSCDKPPADAQQSGSQSDEPDLGDYQRAWDQELGGDPAWVFVGIGIALVLFASLGVLPWAVSYMQDNGIIKPRVHWSEPLGGEPARVNAFQQRHSMTTSFGRPRSE